MLPHGMNLLGVSHSAFSKKFNFRTLPPLMQSIFRGNNKFVGSVTLKKLPKSCIVIDASHNSFSGSINLNNQSLAQ